MSRCPECGLKRVHAPGCPMRMPVSSDPSPKTPPPSSDRLARLEGRVGVLEVVLRDYGPPPPPHPLADAQPREAPRAVPDGVVPPHVRRNLEALAGMTNFDRWQIATYDEKTIRAMLDHIHGAVMTMMAGEDVPRL